MDISVITIIYNVEKYIERALNSLFTQTKTDSVEFILVNDCATDKSMQIAQKVINRYPELNIKIINNKTNKGIAKTRQIALENATGKYLCHCDPDDWLEPNSLEDLYKLAIEGDYDMISFTRVEEYKNATVYLNKVKIGVKTREDILIDGITNGALWNKFIKRSLFTENNISFDDDINCGEDRIIMIKLSMHIKKSICIKKSYLHYTRRKQSTTNTINKRNYITVTQREISILEKNPEFDLIYNDVLRIKFFLFRHDTNKMQTIKLTLINLIFKKSFKEKIKTVYRYLKFIPFELKVGFKALIHKFKRKPKYELFD